nr:hypothetical protein Iba_chr01bCG13880 [Ipomoea batatas]
MQYPGESRMESNDMGTWSVTYAQAARKASNSESHDDRAWIVVNVSVSTLYADQPVSLDSLAHSANMTKAAYISSVDPTLDVNYLSHCLANMSAERHEKPSLVDWSRTQNHRSRRDKSVPSSCRSSPRIPPPISRRNATERQHSSRAALPLSFFHRTPLTPRQSQYAGFALSSGITSAKFVVWIRASAFRMRLNSSSSEGIFPAPAPSGEKRNKDLKHQAGPNPVLFDRPASIKKQYRSPPYMTIHNLSWHLKSEGVVVRNCGLKRLVSSEA